MSECSQHCPFLNRADARCAGHFSLDDLQHAFDYCFGYYQACPTYLELLVERRVRRSRGQEGSSDDRLIQVTLAGEIIERPFDGAAGGAADPASVPHASGV